MWGVNTEDVGAHVVPNMPIEWLAHHLSDAGGCCMVHGHLGFNSVQNRGFLPHFSVEQENDS